MKVCALIPCRTGSKGIPNKNFKDFCGKPLWVWSLDGAVDSGIFNKIILSSDGGFEDDIPTNEIIVVDNKRPDYLSDDKTSLDDLLSYYRADNEDIDIWCLLQPTSPLRTGQDIKNAYALFTEEDANGQYKNESLVSVYQHPVLAWIRNAIGIPGDDDNPQPLPTYHYTKRPNRQDRLDWCLENGAIYFTRSYILKAFNSRLHGTIVAYEMPHERSIEIDTPYDWFIAEQTVGYLNGLG